MALRKRVAPGIATLRSLDPALAPLSVSSSSQPLPGDIAVVVCRGFGGMNTALVVRGAVERPVQ
jgi:3-oxoacyl-(acyl-carrier-protein) synthase